jgi:hypothetical protein
MTPRENGSISRSSIVVVDSRQVSVDVGEETLILHVETGGYYSLKKVAAQIWELLQRPVTVSHVGETLSRQYGIPRERCEADLLELLSELEKRGLVRIVSDDSTDTL